ncbi:MAG: telomere binding protein [Thelocarpon superellum]|nr:MAG: telomere binding protein [Thelocarpon superellum]
MEELLRPIKTSKVGAADDGDEAPVDGDSPAKSTTANDPTVTTVKEAILVLQSKPPLTALRTVLRFLTQDQAREHDFNLHLPTPQTSQVVRVLVDYTVLDYWSALNAARDGVARSSDQHAKDRRLLLRCLSNVAGLGGILARLRALIAAEKEGKKPTGVSQPCQHLADLVDLLSDLLSGPGFVQRIWTGLNSCGNPTQRSMVWKELLALLGTGKVLSTVAEAAQVIGQASKDLTEQPWVGDGALYSQWLGQNLVVMASPLTSADEASWRAASDLLGKSLRLGYGDQIVDQLTRALLQSTLDREHFRFLTRSLMAHEQRNILYLILRLMPKTYLTSTPSNGDQERWWEVDAGKVGGAAALIAGLIEGIDSLKNDLVSWLTGSSGGGAGDAVNIRRAAIAALSGDEGRDVAVLEKSLQQFGDSVYMKHTPVLYQEVNAQVLLLAAGYVHRASAAKLASICRSSVYLNAISNRLSASSQRSRFLGVIVGTTISELIDAPDKRLTFGMEELEDDGARWYQSLTRVKDRIGKLEDLVAPNERVSGKGGPRKITPRPTIETHTSKIISIEEVDDDEDEIEDDDDDDDDDDDEFRPYEKPDSDAEDSEEDATMVQRNKPTAPVYIRDLINGLRDTENYDRQRLALTNAATLIRRKANFGTEVSEHLEELATLLVGLADKYDMDRFAEMRQQAMIATLVARPLRMGQWFSRTFFEGDYSIGQRMSILNTLGMGAREVAGFAEEDGKITGATSLLNTSFPTKQLPVHLHQLYASEHQRQHKQEQRRIEVDELASRLERTMIEPMALEAADKVTGPNALKVRTFSSRMEVEKKRKKPVANELAKIVAAGFFFPLTGRWWVQLKT